MWLCAPILHIKSQTTHVWSPKPWVFKESAKLCIALFHLPISSSSCIYHPMIYFPLSTSPLHPFFSLVFSLTPTFCTPLVVNNYIIIEHSSEDIGNLILVPSHSLIERIFSWGEKFVYLTLKIANEAAYVLDIDKIGENCAWNGVSLSG